MDLNMRGLSKEIEEALGDVLRAEHFILAVELLGSLRASMVVSSEFCFDKTGTDRADSDLAVELSQLSAKPFGE